MIAHIERGQGSAPVQEVETVVFLGDSLTQGGDWSRWFPDVRTVNLGKSGNTSDDVLARLATVVAEKPDEILLLIGTNDLSRHDTVDHLVHNVQLILVDLRRDLPSARLLLQSIMPRGREFAEQIQMANVHLRQFTTTVSAQYLDLWLALAGEGGEINLAFSDDRLHLNGSGYAAWLAELQPALERLRN